MRVIAPDGTSTTLGTTGADPTISLIDFSRRETDAFGVTTIVRRAFARRMGVRLGVPYDTLDAVQSRLADLRATAATWVASDRLASLSIEGFLKDFDIEVPGQSLSYCRLTVEGLAETATAADPGGDPSANGKASTLRFLDPIAITGGALVSSSVAEADEAAWSASVTYAKGDRVFLAATHRIYESVTAANVGADPAGGSGKWLDAGPTNRHAMFDQALGTSTVAFEPVSIVLKASVATSGLAILDTNAATVRVQAPGYDRTQAPNMSGKALFLDLVVAAGASVTVTITPATGSVEQRWTDSAAWTDSETWRDSTAASGSSGDRRWDDGGQWLDADVWRDSLAAGDGSVTIGTMLFGTLRNLGVTEASPTAGIIDYSRKETDEFGEVTVVPRTWAKRMAARALIRTNAVDAVVNRLAAARARPCLWFGQQALDCLTVYGFYRDFDIVVGTSVSKLSLSIEGLSKAAPIVPLGGGEVAWPDITDPDGTKPTDNADKTSDNVSKDTAAVGGVPAGQITGRLHTLETETIPAVGAAVAAAGERITAANSLANAAKDRADKAVTDIEAEIERALGADAATNQRIDALSASGGYDDTAIKAEVKRVDETAISRDAARGRQVETISATLTDADTAIKAEARRIDEAAVSRDSALTKRVDQVVTSVETTDAAWRAETQRIETAAVNRDSATNQRIDNLSAGGGTGGTDTFARAEIQRVETAAVDRDGALGQRIDTIKSSVDTVDSRIAAKAQEVTTAYTAADTALAGRSAALEAQMRGEQGSNLRSRIEASETALTDGRFATAQRAANIEASVGNVTSRLGTVETATTDGRFAAAQTVADLRAEYNGTKTEVSDQRGVITGIGQKTAAYVRIVADAGNGRAALSLWSDQYGGAWQLTGDGIIVGNLLVDGIITTTKMANGAITAFVAVQGSNVSVSNGATSTPASASLTPSGTGFVRVDLQFDVRVSAQGTSGTARIFVRRTQNGSSVIVGRQLPLILADTGTPLAFWFLDTPAGGSPATYDLVASSDSGNRIFFVSNPALALTESKK